MRIMIRRNYTQLQVVTDYFKSEPKIVSIRESITPLYGKVNNFQIRDLLSTLQENSEENFYNLFIFYA